MAPDRGTTLCRICQKPRPAANLIHGELIHGPVMELIQKRHSDWTPQDVVCLSCLNRIRAEYVEDVLQSEKGELSALDQEVIKSLRDQEILSQNLNVEFDRQLTVGQRVADKVAEFGGSWSFILSFGGILVVWISVNSIALLRQPFDPYPYILLNLVLSCLAAIQAPVIMMSQNRQEAKDRLRAEHDYQVNLKAELEIRHLTWKMDQLLNHQWQRLLEIQKIQTELMEELLRKPSRGQGG
ncbi:MAG TPA: DUF1003 domain-containing protein [Candidatus Methylomirabilis sp.]|nr:DUF1003 domain-containing protein [Candidatus Methylomirabilis sp.]